MRRQNERVTLIERIIILTMKSNARHQYDDIKLHDSSEPLLAELSNVAHDTQRTDRERELAARSYRAIVNLQAGRSAREQLLDQTPLENVSQTPVEPSDSIFARFGITRQNVYHVALGLSVGMAFFRPITLVIAVAIILQGYFLNKAEQ